MKDELGGQIMKKFVSFYKTMMKAKSTKRCHKKKS